MKKTDSRHSNTKQVRLLKNEMKLFTLLNGKFITTNKYENGERVKGIIVDLKIISSLYGLTELKLDNGLDYTIRTKNGKPALTPGCHYIIEDYTTEKKLEK